MWLNGARMNRKTPVRRPPRAATRERLLEEACALFADRGWHGTRVQDVCRAADANIAAVNYHFGGKEGLYRAVWDRALERAVDADAIELSALSADADREWLYKYVRACVLSVFDTGAGGILRRLMTHEVSAPSPISQDILANHIAPRYSELLARLRRTIGPNATDYQVGCCAFAINALFSCLAMNVTARHALFRTDTPSPAEAERFTREICAFLLGGIRALRGVPPEVRRDRPPTLRV